MLHIFPHWNWPGREGQTIDVWGYSNCAEVELSLNGISLGRKVLEKNGHLEWTAPYAPGRLLATGFDAAGCTVLTAAVETTGAPAALTLSPDRPSWQADGEDVLVVDVAVTAAAGRTVPLAGNDVTFAVAGPARILGVGNGNPCSHEPDTADRSKADHGLCQVILQATREPGEVAFTATSPKLAAARLLLPTQKAAARPFVPAENAQGVKTVRTDTLTDGAL